MKMTEQEVKELLRNNLNICFISDFFVINKLDESILEKYIGYFDEFYRFEKIVSNEVPEGWWIEFVENELDIEDLWYFISRHQILSESFINKHSNKVNWFFISLCQELSESFIERYIDKVNWNMISCEQKLSEEFIERHYDKVSWLCISKHQKLSEEFIERHSEEVNWYLISKCQKLSDIFLKKHRKEIDHDFFSSF